MVFIFCFSMMTLPSVVVVLFCFHDVDKIVVFSVKWSPLEFNCKRP